MKNNQSFIFGDKLSQDYIKLIIQQFEEYNKQLEQSAQEKEELKKIINRYKSDIADVKRNFEQEAKERTKEHEKELERSKLLLQELQKDKKALLKEHEQALKIKDNQIVELRESYLEKVKELNINFELAQQNNQNIIDKLLEEYKYLANTISNKHDEVIGRFNEEYEERLKKEHEGEEESTEEDITPLNTSLREDNKFINSLSVENQELSRRVDELTNELKDLKREKEELLQKQNEEAKKIAFSVTNQQVKVLLTCLVVGAVSVAVGALAHRYKLTVTISDYITSKMQGFSYARGVSSSTLSHVIPA